MKIVKIRYYRLAIFPKKVELIKKKTFSPSEFAIEEKSEKRKSHTADKKKCPTREEMNEEERRKKKEEREEKKRRAEKETGAS